MISKLSVSVLLFYILVLSGRSLTQEFEAKSKVVARIGHGKLAALKQFPYAVHIRTMFTKPSPMVTIMSGGQCTGSIITPSWVLTATHCFMNNGEAFTHSVSLKAGTIDFDDDAAPSLQERRGAEVILHEGYERVTQRGDVALIRMDKPFDINEYVKPIAMMNEPLKSTEKGLCIMMGFGNTHNGQNSRLFYILGNAITCSELYGSHRFKSKSYQDVEHVCVKVDKAATSGCPGDSGGPLVCADKLAGSLTGGIGHNLVCGNDTNNFALYQSTAHFYPWIRERIGMNEEGKLRSLQHSKEEEESRDAASSAGINLTVLLLALLCVLQCDQ